MSHENYETVLETGQYRQNEYKCESMSISHGNHRKNLETKRWENSPISSKWVKVRINNGIPLKSYRVEEIRQYHQNDKSKWDSMSLSHLNHNNVTVSFTNSIHSLE